MDLKPGDLVTPRVRVWLWPTPALWYGSSQRYERQPFNTDDNAMVLATSSTNGTVMLVVKGYVGYTVEDDLWLL